MACVPVRLIIPSLKLGDYLSVQAYKPCSISHLRVGFNLEMKCKEKQAVCLCYNVCYKKIHSDISVLDNENQLYT